MKPKTRAKVERILEKAKLDKFNKDVDHWIKHLRLSHWKFEIEVVPWEDGKEPTFAENRMDPNYEASYIRIYDPDTIPKEAKGVRDIEVTLVHELLHTRLVYVASLSKKKKKSWAVEMAVETLAQALVANRRGISPEDLR